jgi:hypothetical protein
VGLMIHGFDDPFAFAFYPPRFETIGFVYYFMGIFPPRLKPWAGFDLIRIDGI